MDDNLKASIIFAQAVAAQIECQSMLVANAMRERRGETPAYGEEHFLSLLNRSGLVHNDLWGRIQS